MLKRLFSTAAVVIIGLVSLSAQSLAQSPDNLSVAAGYAKGHSKFNIVVKDTPGTKLVLYVNDKSPTRATVNKHDWATFNKVGLTGTGKLSFTKVLNGKRGTYQQPIAYTKRYTVSKSKVSFSDYVTVATVTTTKPVAFTTTTRQNSSLAKGTKQLQTKGVDGTEKLTYQVTYTNAQETARILVSTVVTTPSVNEVVENGSYVAPVTPTPAPSAAANCTNGTYVNSSGNTVCSPETAASAPAGATAQCNDGTYSFSQHHSGTCSSHGGVARWL